MNNTKNGDFDEQLKHEAGEGEFFHCFFCLEQTTDPERMACAPVDAGEAIKGLYADRPRCRACEMEIQTNLSMARIRALADVMGADRAKATERSEEEKAALDAIYDQQDNQALSEADVDRLAEERGEARVYYHSFVNPRG